MNKSVNFFHLPLDKRLSWLVVLMTRIARTSDGGAIGNLRENPFFFLQVNMGYAFVSFSTPAEAHRFAAAFDGKEIRHACIPKTKDAQGTASHGGSSVCKARLQVRRVGGWRWLVVAVAAAHG